MYIYIYVYTYIHIHIYSWERKGVTWLINAKALNGTPAYLPSVVEQKQEECDVG
jgi:hypothetical protein